MDFAAAFTVGFDSRQLTAFAIVSTSGIFCPLLYLHVRAPRKFSGRSDIRDDFSGAPLQDKFDSVQLCLSEIDPVGFKKTNPPTRDAGHTRQLMLGQAQVATHFLDVSHYEHLSTTFLPQFRRQHTVNNRVKRKRGNVAAHENESMARSGKASAATLCLARRANPSRRQ
jgi:hypothetical protein